LNYVYLGLAVAFNVAAYAVFKTIAAKEHTAIWFALFTAGLGLGAINAFCFTAALRHISLSEAYPVFAGASIAFIVILSAVGFNERISATNLSGAVLVVVGIALLTR
jgi:multidrug transporter EmrE-like cation transporter